MSSSATPRTRTPLDPFRILFIGSLRPFLTTRARRDALVHFGHQVESIDQRDYVESANPILSRLTFWTLRTPGVHRFNREILERARRFRPQIVWIEKGVFVFPQTLRELRRLGGVLVYHNTDDWRADTRMHWLHWRFLLRGLRDYDVHITSNLHNVEEFRRDGLPRVYHMELCANRAVPEPSPMTAEERAAVGAPVGFIGHWEPYTEELLLHLIRAHIPLKIYGPNWESARARSELQGVCQYRGVWGEEYGRAIVSFDINLGIVSTQNRNHTASRTFQIPALGAFLLHQRNPVVAGFFREGEEAAFFEGPDELLAQCRRYLADPEERRRVAAAGRRRCHESGYFEEDRVAEIAREFPAWVDDLGARTT